MPDKWTELRETIEELATNGGTASQEDVCRFLLRLMQVLDQQEEAGEIPATIQNDGL